MISDAEALSFLLVVLDWFLAELDLFVSVAFLRVRRGCVREFGFLSGLVLGRLATLDAGFTGTRFEVFPSITV